MGTDQPVRILVADDEDEILEEYQAIFEAPVQDSRFRQDLSTLEDELFGGGNPARGPLKPDQPSYELARCSLGEAAVLRVIQSVEFQRPFAVAFLDVRMPPGIDGVETAVRIREADANINIVFVTGFSDLDPRQIGERVQPRDKFLYCRKPVQPAELRQLADALSARWLADRALNATSGRLRHLLECSPAVIFSCAPAEGYRLNYVSDNVGEKLGCTRLELRAGPRGWLDLIHDDDRQLVMNKLKKALITGQSQVRYRFGAPGRPSRLVQTELNLIPDANGAPQELVGYWVVIEDPEENATRTPRTSLAAAN